MKIDEDEKSAVNVVGDLIELSMDLSVAGAEYRFAAGDFVGDGVTHGNRPRGATVRDIGDIDVLRRDDAERGRVGVA